MRKYSEYLADKEREANTPEVFFSFSDCDECNEYRTLIEAMSKWMSIGSFKQNTPQKMIKEFRTTMKKANAIIVKNKRDRGEF